MPRPAPRKRGVAARRSQHRGGTSGPWCCPSDRRIVRSIVHIASEAGLSVVAEGVQDAGALALLREYDLQYAQGFHLGRPSAVASSP